MTKTEFYKEVAKRLEKNVKEVKETFEMGQTVAYEEMSKQGKVVLFDGLTLEGVHKDAKTARNPLTGAMIDVPEKVVPKAKFGAVAKRTVNGEV